MIIRENITVHGVDLVKTYSDLYLIKQLETGILYDEAIDIPGKYTYVETDELKLVNESEHELREL
jgi:hypothetical protein